MEIYHQQEDITVFGVHVKTFPNGIKEAFDQLVKEFGKDRSYYGISWMEESNQIKYYAMVPEVYKGEANKYHYEKLIVSKGEYRTETIYNWLNKVDSIKDVFNRLMPDRSPDKDRPCVEWYKSDDEMLCMVKA